jgi:hypothetical protein
LESGSGTRSTSIRKEQPSKRLISQLGVHHQPLCYKLCRHFCVSSTVQHLPDDITTALHNLDSFRTARIPLGSKKSLWISQLSRHDYTAHNSFSEEKEEPTVLGCRHKGLWERVVESMDGRRRPRYVGEDTRLTSEKELKGWYSYGLAAEVFAICGTGR